MKTVTLSARYDGERIRLDESHVIPKNARLLVTVLPPEEDQIEVELRDFWTGLSGSSLERAYGSDEPEYSLDSLRETNPDFTA